MNTETLGIITSDMVESLTWFSVRYLKFIIKFFMVISKVGEKSLAMVVVRF